jgi:hypothetical protein
MDRKALIACAGLLFPWGAVLAAGDDAAHAPPFPGLLDPAVVDSQSRPIMRDLSRWPLRDQGSVTLLSDQTDSKSPSSQSPAQPAQIAPDAAAGAERMQLPWAGAQRSPETVAAVRRANLRVRGGFERAARGAHYSARSEFIAALQTIAQARDNERGTRHCSRSLEQGLLALSESKDFLGRNPVNGEAPVAQILLRHQSKLIDEAAAADMPAHLAAEKYCSFAQEQLAAAVFGEPTGSMALFGLAKVSQVSANAEPSRATERRMHADYLYRAALLAEKNNFCAANELAVLLVETGHLEEARSLLVQSVSVVPNAVTWRNLAAVHDRLGEVQLAQQARAQADHLPAAPAASNAPAVEWLDAAAFAKLTSASDIHTPMPPMVRSQTPVQTSPTTGAAAPLTTAKKPPNRNRWTPRR